MDKAAQWTITIFVVVLICFLFIWGYTPDSEAYTVSSRVLTTAAHLGELDGYELVYVDEEADYAVHVKKDYVASQLSVGDEVQYLDKYSATVSETHGQDFIIQPDVRETILPGTSGEVVSYNGIPVGYISGWDGQGGVRCIYF